jgi:selenocysteine lyase/cysteine desulfurase
MLSRKNFIYTSAFGVLPLAVTPALLRCSSALPPQDEDFWQHIRSQFVFSNGLINLNNGGVSPQPLMVQKAHEENLKLSNSGPSYFMWRQLDKQREPLRQRLADMFGCMSAELAINRNTTEGLNTIIAGLPLKAGDEVVLSKYDYPNMINAWKQRATRDGIVLKWVDLQLPEEDEDSLVAKYKAAISPRTKLVHITHIINWTGQILPVKKIALVAHEAGVEVLLDAAHSFAHIDFKLKEWSIDYAAASLHKWLCAPFGTGILFVKKDKIAKVWPAFSAPLPEADNIGKFECIGTRSFAAEMAANAALDFHDSIGIERKTERLRYLKNYWCKAVNHLPNVKLYTSLRDEFSAGISTFAIEGKEPAVIETYLLNTYNIHTSIVKHETLNGIRISPHVYTSTSELDLLIKGIKELAGL